MKRVNLIVAMFVLLPMVAQADTILLRGKPAIKGVKVTSETMKEVSYSKGGKAKKKVASADVVAVIYDREPSNYRLGLQRFSTGDFLNAISSLKPALSEGDSEQGWVKEYAAYYLGRAQLAHGDFRDGAATLKKLLASSPNHRLYPRIARVLAKCQSLEGLHAEAKSTLMKLLNVLEQNGIKGVAVQQAKIAMGEAYAAAAKYSLAADAFKEAAAAGVGKTGLSEELAYHAKGLLVASDLLAKDMPKAKIVLQDLRSAHGKGIPAASAAYRNAKVAILLAQVESGQAVDSKELLEAAFELARVRGENFNVVSELPRNCYLLGLMHLKLEGSLNKAKELAKEYFEETRRLYPESREAFLAREELKKM